MGQTSSDAELSDWGKKPTEFVNKIAASSDKVDQNLFKIFQLRIAERAQYAQANQLEHEKRLKEAKEPVSTPDEPSEFLMPI